VGTKIEIRADYCKKDCGKRRENDEKNCLENVIASVAKQSIVKGESLGLSL
jgi:hypothetical protein